MGRGTESPGAYRGFRLWRRRGEAYPNRPEGLSRTPTRRATRGMMISL
jgi:hypothetical protein